MVMSQVMIPFHVTRGTYFTSSNTLRAINNVVPGISAAATGFQAAPHALPALPAEAAPSQAQPQKESLQTPSKDTSTGQSSKQGPGEAGTSGHGGDRSSSKKSSSGAPLMKQSRLDFKAKEQKIQTGGTPGSKRSSSGRKLDAAAIDKTWVGFEKEDKAHNTARWVLEMNPLSGGALLSTSDHKLSRGGPVGEGRSSQTEGRVLLGRQRRAPGGRVLPLQEKKEDTARRAGHVR